MWLDEWVRGNKRKVAFLCALVLVICFFWYMLFPYPTLNIVEFVSIEIDITLNETELDTRVPVDAGPHCPSVRRRGGQVVIENNILTRATQVVVLIDYEMHHYERSSFSWGEGGRFKDYLIERSSVVFELVSPVNDSIVLVEINIDGDELTIDGETIPPNDVWEGTFVYPIMDGMYTVTEVIELENLGNKIAFSNRPWPCD